jgi:phospholipase C
MPQVKKIVFLMLENRSLDNVLGWLYQDQDPKHVIPEGGSKKFDGLLPDTYFAQYQTYNGKIHNYYVKPAPDNLGEYQDVIPYWDPTEEMYKTMTWNGVLNQLFGDYNRIDGLPAAPTVPRMLGFYQDYYSHVMHKWEGMDILWTFTPKQLPAINTLALSYAVSDRWFCSVPTQTNPNRAYSLMGTSQGNENNSSEDAVEQFCGPTLFNALGTKVSWGLYFKSLWQNQSYTEYTFPGISDAPNGRFGSHVDFFTDAKNGNLPEFTYLEPEWGYGLYGPWAQGTDYHPPTHVWQGEQFLLDVYQALRNGPDWNETLFVVTFDEHGGTYDHVPPPWGAINPDGIKGNVVGFKFDLYGVRVPTLLISPFVKQSTVFRKPDDSRQPFDHTSFMKTFLLWAGVDLNSVDFGKRMPAAPTFEAVLSPGIVNEITVDVKVPAAAPVQDPSSPDRRGLLANELLEGIPAAAARRILHDSESLADVRAGIEKYRADPAAFQASLGRKK